MSDTRLKAHEIDSNYDAFQRVLGSILRDHGGQYALLRATEIVSYHSDPFEADLAGRTLYPDGLYSIQQVNAEPVELGIYANVPN